LPRPLRKADVNFDYPAEPYLEPERSRELQRPVIRRLREHLLGYGIAPLHLLSGRGQAAPELRGRSVILVDDGLATGASMKAAVEAVRKTEPRKLIVAVPVAARSTAEEFRQMLDGPGEEFVCLHEPEALDGVGRWYDDFRQVDDEKVRHLLAPPAGGDGNRATGS
jgi:predicted phosphoribosyltransferase